jgi:dethiobiotin synthetase
MKIFVTGISTDVGKTIASAIITQALEADYWKPIQSGDLQNTDSMKVRALVSNSKTVVHPESYRLQTPVSPHFAAEIDKTIIETNKIVAPKTQNHLVIEGAGGLLVPINQSETILDLIQLDYKVIVVSRHYLGSINHTLLTIEMLKSKKRTIAGIIFSGSENPSTQKIIIEKTGIKYIGRIDEEPYFDTNVVDKYAQLFREKIVDL